MATNGVHPLEALMRERIVILDGAMGTMIQRYKLSEAQYRGERFKDHAKDLKGNNDLLQLTQPQDIIETNTFGATAVAQEDYRLGHVARELNVVGARLARAACTKYSTPDKARF